MPGVENRGACPVGRVCTDGVRVLRRGDTGLPGGELFGGADRGVEKAVGDGIQPGLLERVLSGTAAGGMERGVRFESHEEKGVVGQGDQLFHETGCRGVQAGVV